MKPEWWSTNRVSTTKETQITGDHDDDDDDDDRSKQNDYAGFKSRIIHVGSIADKVPLD